MDSTGQRIARKLRHTASQWDLDEPSDLEQMAEFIDSELAPTLTQLRGYESAWKIVLKELGLPEDSQDAVRRIRELARERDAVDALLVAAEEKLGAERCAYAGPETVRAMRETSDNLRECAARLRKLRG